MSGSPNSHLSHTNKLDFSAEREQLSVKLRSLGEQIADIQAKRKKLSPLSKYSVVSPTKSNNSKDTKKSSKKMLHHPKLEYVVAEAAFSPYLTRPEASYSERTLSVPGKIKEARFAGKEPTRETIPVNMKKAKKVFMDEIVNFKPRFEFHEKTKNLPLQYFEPPPDLFIPGVHAKPRKTVFPNKYQPLKGHTGKLSHIEAFLSYDPNDPSLRPQTTPLEQPRLSQQECEKLLKQLEKEANRPGTSPQSGSKLLRSSSGVLKAHAGRGGPDKYRKEKRYKKAIQGLISYMSTAADDEQGNADDTIDLSGMYFDNAEDELNPDIAAKRPPQFPFDEVTVRIKKVVIKNLKSPFVFGKKDPYVQFKYGKRWTGRTPTSYLAANPCKWVFKSDDRSMWFDSTSEIVNNGLKLKATVFNENKLRAHVEYGTCKVDIAQAMMGKTLEEEFTVTAPITTYDSTVSGRIMVVLDMIERQTEVHSRIENTPATTVLENQNEDKDEYCDDYDDDSKDEVRGDAKMQHDVKSDSRSSHDHKSEGKTSDMEHADDKYTDDDFLNDTVSDTKNSNEKLPEEVAGDEKSARYGGDEFDDSSAKVSASKDCDEGEGDEYVDDYEDSYVGSSGAKSDEAKRSREEKLGEGSIDEYADDFQDSDLNASEVMAPTSSEPENAAHESIIEGNDEEALNSYADDFNDDAACLGGDLEFSTDAEDAKTSTVVGGSVAPMSNISENAEECSKDGKTGVDYEASVFYDVSAEENDVQPVGESLGSPSVLGESSVMGTHIVGEIDAKKSSDEDYIYEDDEDGSYLSESKA
eukprot:CAMPEP_0185034514 /NCGR_PEP_ID=MMETSP1103-20130426/24482_1 /TAXON_ID=36769 /ORGANISM="Paraphysomonas bandaiensis, Strain Caron Lab Isolate" /LENGTH=805 /DNA_ID=CAMNT_0027571203 /DNA_START=102 /DNA_END=2519 /DNA_ORIENTATION=-